MYDFCASPPMLWISPVQHRIIRLRAYCATIIGGIGRSADRSYQLTALATETTMSASEASIGAMTLTVSEAVPPAGIRTRDTG